MKAKIGRSVLGVMIFTLCYFLAGVLLVVLRQNYEFLVYIGVMALVLLGVYYMHTKVTLVAASLWCMSIWGLIHLAGGLLPVPAGWPVSGDRVLYSVWLIPEFLKYDNIAHTYGFAVTTWLCWQGLSATVRERGKPVQPTFGLLTLAAAAGMGFGAVNEVLEFAVTLVVPNTNVGGYVNTGWDLVCNMLGSMGTVLIIYYSLRKTSV